MKIFKIVLTLGLVFSTFAMETPDKTQLISPTAADLDGDLLRGLITTLRCKLIGAFAGFTALQQFLKNHESDSMPDFFQDRWTDVIFETLCNLEELESLAGQSMKTYLQEFDKSSGQDYLKMVSLSQACKFNCCLWKELFVTSFEFYKNISDLNEGISKEFSTLSGQEARKRKFFSNLKRVVEGLNSPHCLKGLAILKEQFSQNKNQMFIVNKETFQLILSSAEAIKYNLVSNGTIFKQFTEHYAKTNPKIIKATELEYYRKICQLRSTYELLSSQLQSLMAQSDSFVKILDQFETFDVARFFDILMPHINLKEKCRNTPQTLPNPDHSIKLSDDLQAEGNSLNEESTKRTIHNHLIIACTFSYLNSIYKHIEQHWSELPIQKLEIKLKTLLTQMQVYRKAQAMGEKCSEEAIKIEDECRQLASTCSILKKDLWKFIRNRFCAAQWKQLEQAIEELSSCPKDIANFVWQIYTTGLELPIRSHQHDQHSKTLVNEWLTIPKLSPSILILDHNACPYIAELYKMLTKTEFMFTPFYASEETLAMIRQNVGNFMSKKIQALNPKSKDKEPAFSGPVIEEEPLVLLESSPKQVLTASVSKQQPKPITLSWNNFVRLLEEAQAKFVSTISVHRESPEAVILRQWRGYSSLDDMTLTLYKVPVSEQKTDACNIIINPDILKKSKDSPAVNWDKYHAFASAVNAKYITCCGIILQKTTPLVGKIKLTIPKDSYAICLRAKIGRGYHSIDYALQHKDTMEFGTNGYIVYLVNEKSHVCFHCFFHTLE